MLDMKQVVSEYMERTLRVAETEHGIEFKYVVAMVRVEGDLVGLLKDLKLSDSQKAVLESNLINAVG